MGKESGYAVPFSSGISKENEGETGKEERGIVRQSNKEVCSSEVCRKQRRVRHLIKERDLGVEDELEDWD